MPDGQVVFEISGDNRKVRQSLSETTAAIEREAGKWDQETQDTAGSMESSMSKMFKNISLAAVAATVGKTLWDWGKAAVAAASDLEEVQNVVDVTFGSGASQIDAWAKNASQQFGLTETQAKKFTSTLGAMMKSAGMAGPEIVTMSEDLAGLAADMASFYNLDFETAFQKIRSGISGETEPLKQLGINMSVANLEAYALTQGITKAFDQMSQGEQTMLRYQYLMQATADAQGDFARTSNGYANSVRRLETAWDTISTKLGGVLLPMVSQLAQSLAGILTDLTAQPERTILDTFNEIDLDTAAKLSDIQKTAQEANALVGVLEEISGHAVKTSENTNLENFISVLAKDITGLSGALTKAKNEDVEGALGSLADALGKEIGGDPEKWKTLLTAVSGNLGSVTQAVGDDDGQTAAWMTAAANAADDLGPEYAGYWQNLLTALGDNAGEAISALAGGKATGNNLGSIAEGSNKLGALTGVKWSSFIGALQGLDNKDSIPTNLSGVADALAKNIGGSASQWETLLTAIGTKLPDVTTAVGDDGTQTKEWLSAAAEAADDLGSDYSTLWANLLQALGDNAGDAIKALAGGEQTGGNLASIARGANGLGQSAGGNWRSFIGAINGLENKDSVPANLQGVAEALATNLGGSASGWQTLLTTLKNTLPTVTTAVSQDGTLTPDFLTKMAEAADDLGSDYSTMWTNLLSALGTNAGAAIKALEGGSTAGASLSDIATGANAMGLMTGTKWSSFAEALSSLDGTEIGNDLNSIADALSYNFGGKPEEWARLLTTLSADLTSAKNAIDQDDGATASWMEIAAESAKKLGGDYAQKWESLLSALGDKAGAAITALQGGDTAGGSLGAIAQGANQLGFTAGTKWDLFIAALQGVTKEKNIPATLSGIAGALQKDFGGSADAWTTILLAVGNNLPAMTTAVNQDGTVSKAWLEDVAAAADDLGGDYSNLWRNLLSALGQNAGAAVSALARGASSGTTLQNMAVGAGMLGDNAPALWESLLTSLLKVDKLQNVFSNSSAPDNVKKLAEALSGSNPDTSRAAAWQTFLGALNDNAAALSTLTETPVDETKQWLSDLAGAANTLNPENAEGWSLLMGSFVTGLPGLKDTEEGQAFFQLMAQEFLAMGTESEEAKAGLMALGMSTEDIDSAQRDWLETCKRLVKTLPGLSSLVNTQTGAVKGGTSAINAYIEQYRKYNEIAEAYDRHKRKGQAIADEFADIDQLKYEVMLLDKMSAAEQTEYANIQKRLEQIVTQYANAPHLLFFDPEYNKLSARQKELEGSYYGQYVAKSKELATRQKAYENAVAEYNKEGEVLEAIYGTEEDALANYNKQIEEARKEMTLLERAASGDADAITSVSTAVQGAIDALTALADYQEQVREETARTVEGVIKGFEKIETPANKARREMEDLTGQIEQLNAAGEDTKSLETTKQSLDDSIPSVQKMTSALETQLQFMEEYQKELALAKENGVDKDLLASLADGSEESFDYLYALNHSGGDIQKLNKMYQDVQKAREEFVTSLTDEKLAVDETYDGLIQKANEALDALDMGDAAGKNVSEMCAAITASLADALPGITEQVDSIIAQLARLASSGMVVSMPIVSRFMLSTSTSASGSHANGLDFVPYDGYLAFLHQGERIQTAAEAELSRRYGLQQPSMDPGSLGSAIGANMGNMQIIWHGRVVADVLSDMQGDQYRALERSGWKS